MVGFADYRDHSDTVVFPHTEIERPCATRVSAPSSSDTPSMTSARSAAQSCRAAGTWPSSSTSTLSTPTWSPVRSDATCNPVTDDRPRSPDAPDRNTLVTTRQAVGGPYLRRPCREGGNRLRRYSANRSSENTSASREHKEVRWRKKASCDADWVETERPRPCT